MNNSQFPLAHPLSCLDRANEYRDAVKGRAWQAQREKAIIDLPSSIVRLLVAALCTFVLLYEAGDAEPWAIATLILVVLYTGVKGITSLFRGIKELRALNAMPRHCLPEEMRIVRNLYLSLNADLARFYQQRLLPRYANREATSAQGITLLAATDELVRLDGLLYVIGQQYNDLDACSDAVRERDLGHAIIRLCLRELPEEIAEPVGLAI